MIALTGLSPADGEKNVALDALIEFTIADGGDGIDISTLIVEVSGFRAIEGTSFGTGFQGTYSEILSDGSNYIVTIDQETDFRIGQTVGIQVQVQDLTGSYFNRTYVFKIIPAEPVLVDYSPESGEVLTSLQNIFLQFEDSYDGIDNDSINITLNGLDIVVNGSFQSGWNGLDSGITSVTNGVAVRIDPIEDFEDGQYLLNYSVADPSGNTLRGGYTFDVALPEAMLPSVFPQANFIGYRQGMRQVSNLGTGDSLKFEWNEPIGRSYKAEAFALIYQNTKRLQVFDEDPVYMAPSTTTEVDVGGYTTGLTMFFALRAMEAYRGTFDLTGMEQAAEGLYRFPQPTTIAQTISEASTKIYVESVAGYPEKGLLLVESEVIKYTSKSVAENAFIVPSGGRGLNNTTPSIYVEGDDVKLFVLCQDKNTVIIQGTPTYRDGYQSGRTFNNVGLIVTDYTDADQKFFQGFDYCGYHRAQPDLTLTGQEDCGSYLGGEFNGFRGMNIFDRMVSREEVLLEQVGEPVVLLRRKWSGEVCSCKDSRRNHPKRRTCPECYGTGYVGGFDQYVNPRRNDTRLMVSFGETQEDLKLGEHRHFEQDYNPNCWTLPMPTIRDRDILVRYDFTDDVEFRYEVQHVTREKLFYRHYTKQRFALVRLDKTNVYYTYPVVLPDVLVK